MSVYYHRATSADDADLRALLRNNAMPSWVQMAMTREPAFFADAQPFGHEWVLLARESASGQAVGMCACTDLRVHCNGQPATIGYLGGLRIAPAWRHRLAVLRGGFAAVHAAGSAHQPPLWFTSIAADNLPARRLLEAGLRGLPRYRPLNDLCTLALPAARGKRHGLWQPAQAADIPALCALHNQQARIWQFAPVLDAATVSQSGIPFYVIRTPDGELAACMALWNPHAHKQVQIHGYRWPLGALRPIYNLWARLARRVALPAAGENLPHAFMAFLAYADTMQPQAIALIEDALALTPAPVLTLGLHAQHPWLPALQQIFKPWIWRTRIYAVDFADEAAETLDVRTAQPEVALL